MELIQRTSAGDGRSSSRLRCCTRLESFQRQFRAVETTAMMAADDGRGGGGGGGAASAWKGGAASSLSASPANALQPSASVLQSLSQPRWAAASSIGDEGGGDDDDRHSPRGTRAPQRPLLPALSATTTPPPQRPATVPSAQQSESPLSNEDRWPSVENGGGGEPTAGVVNNYKAAQPRS